MSGVYEEARGSGVSAFLAFFLIALAGYLAFACVFLLENPDVHLFRSPLAVLQILTPAWAAVLLRFPTNPLSRTIYWVAAAMGLVTFGVCFYVLGFRTPAGERADAAIQFAAALAWSGAVAFLISEAIRPWVPDYYRARARTLPDWMALAGAGLMLALLALSQPRLIGNVAVVGLIACIVIAGIWLVCTLWFRIGRLPAFFSPLAHSGISAAAAIALGGALFNAHLIAPHLFIPWR